MAHVKPRWKCYLGLQTLTLKLRYNRSLLVLESLAFSSLDHSGSQLLTKTMTLPQRARITLVMAKRHEAIRNIQAIQPRYRRPNIPISKDGELN